MRTLLILAFATMVSGCNSTLAPRDTSGGTLNKFEAVALDKASRPATHDLLIDVRPWSEATRKFPIMRGDPIYVFPHGKSYIRTFSLPANSTGSKLEIYSYYTQDFPTTLFVPALMFLDATGKEVQNLPEPEYEIVNGLNDHIEVHVPIPTSAVHVVIYTTPIRVNERMVFRTYSMNAVVPAPTFQSHNTGFGGSYEGILRLKIGAK